MLYTCVHAAPLAFIDLKVLNVLASRACHTFCCSRAWLTPGAPRLLSTVALQPRELQILLAVRTSRGEEQKIEEPRQRFVIEKHFNPLNPSSQGIGREKSSSHATRENRCASNRSHPRYGYTVNPESRLAGAGTPPGRGFPEQVL